MPILNKTRFKPLRVYKIESLGKRVICLNFLIFSAVF